MKFLLDMPLPPRIAGWLNTVGHDAVHARDIRLARAADEEILRHAQAEGRIVLTMDLDFPHLLSSLSAEEPSVILIRLRYPTAAAIQQRLDAMLHMNPRIDLSRTIAVLEETQVRLHRLPLH